MSKMLKRYLANMVGLTPTLTFEPEAPSAAAEVTAWDDSVTMLGDLWLAADLDMRACNLQMRRQHR